MIIGAVSASTIHQIIYTHLPQPDNQFRTINNDHDRIEIWNRETRPRYISQRHCANVEGMKATPSRVYPLSNRCQCIWVTRLLYTASMGFVKMSLLWFYLRLDPRKYMRWAVFFVMFINVGLSLASFIGALAGCSPPSLFWTDPTAEGCMPMAPQQRFYEVNGILNIVTDILTYLLPVPMLYGLQLSWRKKGAILGIFGLGILSIAGTFNLNSCRRSLLIYCEQPPAFAIASSRNSLPPKKNITSS